MRRSQAVGIGDVDESEKEKRMRGKQTSMIVNKSRIAKVTESKKLVSGARKLLRRNVLG